MPLHNFRSVKFATLLVFLLLIYPLAFDLIPPAHAQATGALDRGRISSTNCGFLGLTCSDNDTFIKIGEHGIRYINAFLTLASVIAFGALIYGAFLYVTSRGDETQARAAKLTIIYTLAGLAVIGIAGALVNATIKLF